MLQFNNISELEITQLLDPQEFLIRNEMRQVIEEVVSIIPFPAVLKHPGVKASYRKLWKYRMRDAEGMLRSEYNEEEDCYECIQKVKNEKVYEEEIAYSSEEGGESGDDEPTFSLI